MNKPWFLANLEDASVELRSAIEEIGGLAPDEDFIAKQRIAEVFMKLSFAWNSKDVSGEEVEERYSEWIRYPTEMDIFTGADGHE